MHLVWELDAGLPKPLLNPAVFDLNGNLLGRPDLLDPVAGLVGEYDGLHHRETTTRRRDIGREERFRNHGLEYFDVVAGDLSVPKRVESRMFAARDRALRSQLPRRWRLAGPGGVRPWTLDERMDRRPEPR